MPVVQDVLTLIETLAPLQNVFKDEYDNIGLLLGNRNAPLTKVLLCLDVTESVISEAIQHGAQLIVSHHPFIYAPLKAITTDTPTGRSILAAAKANLNVYSAHTNLDFSANGINDFLAQCLQLKNILPLMPYISQTEGAGRVGDLPAAVPAAALAQTLAQLLGDAHIKIAGNPDALIRRAAVLNGGGGGDTTYIDKAMQHRADCLITADVKHHVALYAREQGFTVIEPQHYTTEHIYIAKLRTLLHAACKTAKLHVEILQALTETNPKI
ncbi:MAG: Nif3-like dinuclear metal center hexameric protein [Firmicutes bacterium]|nr:Nif3-like dinuclear metal center hexameric protein [Bacillota bacterium]